MPRSSRQNSSQKAGDGKSPATNKTPSSNARKRRSTKDVDLTPKRMRNANNDRSVEDQRKVEFSENNSQNSDPEHIDDKQESPPEGGGAPKGKEIPPPDRNRSRSRSRSVSRSRLGGKSPAKRGSRPASRSISPPGVDHRPKPKSPSNKMSDKMRNKQNEGKQNKKSEPLTFPAAEASPPQSESDDNVSLGVASSDDDFDSRSEGEWNSKTSASADSSDDSSSSPDEDDVAYKRKRRGRSVERKRKKLRRLRDRSRSRSKSREYRGVQHKKKKDKRNKRDINQIVQEALNKQRVQMEAYFERLTKKGKSPTTPVKNNIIKSPSDTTLYAPAVRRMADIDINADSPTTQKIRDLNDKSVDHFIQNVRNNLVFSDEGVTNEVQEAAMQDSTARPQPDDARDHANAAEAAVIRAEKFKAKVDNPRGKDKFYQPVNVIDTLDKPRNEINDDHFIQISCHVDQTTYGQIEKGEFVDLIKIMPKPHNRIHSDDDYALELKHKDAKQYWVPANERERKITGIKQWEAAFRVYAEIYSRANPTKAAEIWQYVATINSAAARFVWDNVALYDFHFRKNMALNPHRSWAKTFTNMWNVDLREHKSQTSNAVSNKLLRNVCWKFNRGGCDYGPRCRFDHRCSY